MQAAETDNVSLVSLISLPLGTTNFSLTAISLLAQAVNFFTQLEHQIVRLLGTFSS